MFTAFCTVFGWHRILLLPHKINNNNHWPTSCVFYSQYACSVSSSSPFAGGGCKRVTLSTTHSETTCRNTNTICCVLNVQRGVVAILWGCTFLCCSKNSTGSRSGSGNVSSGPRCEKIRSWEKYCMQHLLAACILQTMNDRYVVLRIRLLGI